MRAVAWYFSPLSEDEARTILGWRYPPPYQLYNGRVTAAALAELCDAANPYYAARDAAAALSGFACFAEAARVPAGWAAGAYSDTAALDIGLGLRPDCAGRGLGLSFVHAVLDLARALYAPPRFRLTVATFNLRAITVYERAGFRAAQYFVSEIDGALEFVTMLRPA